MATTQINPTRMELTRLKKKLTTAVRGHKLLKDKRDELMRQFLDMVRENKRLREKVEADILAVNQNVMSVDIPVLHAKTRTANPEDIYSYGFAFTSGDLDDAVKSLADILPDLLRLAEIEKSCQLIAAEIEKTRRRVNALEHVMIPETQKNIQYITMKLDENERSTQIRLMKVKDMMLAQAHHYDQPL